LRHQLQDQRQASFRDDSGVIAPLSDHEAALARLQPAPELDMNDILERIKVVNSPG
jgi:hypothetical protein